MRRNSTTAIYQLSKEQKDEMLKEIEAFYLDVRDEEIGLIGCSQILDFFLETLGKQIYNKALDDTQMWHKQMLEHMEAEFYSLYKNV